MKTIKNIVLVAFAIGIIYLSIDKVTGSQSKIIIDESSPKTFLPMDSIYFISLPIDSIIEKEYEPIFSKNFSNTKDVFKQ